VVVLAVVEPGLLDWRGVARVLSERPAEIAGLPDHGRPIAAGEPANFALVDPDGVWTVRGATLASRASNTPYEGMRLPATVVATVLRGRLTTRSGRVAGIDAAWSGREANIDAAWSGRGAPVGARRNGEHQ
jgi:dihydroorotase